MAFYDVRGRVLDKNKRPCKDICVTIYEQDLSQDDLLGIVRTNEDGVFRLRFTEDEFHQHVGEFDGKPELGVIVWREAEGGTPLFLEQVSFEHIDILPNREENLGDIELIEARDRLTGDPEQEVYRGTRSRGMEMTQAVLDYSMERALPLVAEGTGWQNLNEHVDCTFTDDFAAVTRVWEAFLTETLEEIEPNPLLDWFSNQVSKNMFGGLYDPISRRIYLNKAASKILGLEPFIVLLGHELVHLGQFTHHPELLEHLKAAVKRQEKCDTLISSGFINADLAEFHSCIGLAPVMTDLEGHATYVEREFLAAAFGGTLPPQASLLARLFQPLLGGLTQEDAMRVKTRQYFQGYQYYMREHRELAEDALFVPFTRGVSFREAQLLAQEDEVWDAMLEGDFEKAVALHKGLIKRHRLEFGNDHMRHDDLMFVHGVLLAANTDDVDQSAKHFERHVQAIESALGRFHPRTLRAKHRAATTLERNGASAKAWRYYENISGEDKKDQLEDGLQQCNEWFDTGFRMVFLTRAVELANKLRKPAEAIITLYVGFDPEEDLDDLEEDS